MTEPELMTVEDAARACRVGRSTMYEWIAEGLVPTFRIHGVVRIPRSALIRMIDAQVEGTARPTVSPESDQRTG
jgi:excisionase family DNA binding protein